MSKMLTFNEYADKITEEFLERRLRRECTYKRIVLFEKYTPIVIDTISNVWLNTHLQRTQEACWNITGIPTGMLK